MNTPEHTTEKRAQMVHPKPMPKDSTVSHVDLTKMLLRQREHAVILEEHVFFGLLQWPFWGLCRPTTANGQSKLEAAGKSQLEPIEPLGPPGLE